MLDRIIGSKVRTAILRILFTKEHHCLCCFVGLLLAGSLGAAPVPDAMSVTKPGAVRPEGWLRDWSLAAAKGYTGHMEEVDGEFVKAWREDFTPRGEKLNWTEGTWSFEGGAYWFDGLVRLAFQLDDPALKALAKKRLDPVLDRMNGRSIGFCWWLDRQNEQDLKDVKKAGTWLVNWVAGISSRPLSAWYEATGDVRAKKALVDALGSDYWVREFTYTFTLPGGCYEAWRLTGDARILGALQAYAADLVRNPARATFSLPPKAGLEETLGLKRMEIWTKGLPFRHGVITQEDILSVLAAYRVTGDTNFLATVRAWQGFLDRHARLPFGATVMDEEWGHPGPGRGTEACALAAEEWTRINCLAALGEGRWGDDVERTFFNAAPAMTDRAWRNHVYFAVPNRLTARPIGRLSVSNTLEATCATYALKHDPLCCTAGLNRTLPNYVQAMWMKTADGGVAAALYGPCRFETELKGGRFAAVERTDYPFGETVAIEIAAAPAGATTVRFRKPAWCAEARLAVNGADVVVRDEKGFVPVTREWKAGDRVTLTFPMKPRVEVVRDLDETGKDFACLLAGPLLFARGFAEMDANTPAEPVALPVVDPKKLLAGAKLETAPLPRPWDWPLASPVVLHTSDAAGRPLKLVPYGCTKLRVSMFPVGE